MSSLDKTCGEVVALDHEALGDLDAAGLARFREHAAQCSSCRAKLEEHDGMVALLVGTFRWLDTERRPQRQAVLARIGSGATGDGDEILVPARTPLSMRASLARPSALLVAIQALAALLLVAAYVGYATLLHAQRTVAARGATIEVKNLAIALRTYASRRGGRLPAADDGILLSALRGTDDPTTASPLVALGERLRDGRLVDGFGQPYAYVRADDRHGRIYSFGPNGRDDLGTGDDLVAHVAVE